MKNFRIILLSLNLFFLLNCTTGDRNNPYDPGNPDLTAPCIISPVEDQTIKEGQSVRFEVIACDMPNLKYQWSKDGSVLVAETSRALIIKAVTMSHSGKYSCKVSNPKGSISSSAKLTVIK